MTTIIRGTYSNSPRPRIALASLGFALLAACGDSPAASQAQQLAFEFTTAPGLETHWCQYAKLPDRVAAGRAGDGTSATAFRWSWQNAHHWAMYRTLPTLPENVSLNEPFDCFLPGAMQHAAASSLILAGSEVGEQVFPEGTGFTFLPGEIVLVQLHSLNTQDRPVMARLNLEIEMADPKDVANPLGLIQFYDPYIVAEGQGTSTAHMRCRIPRDMTVLFSTTHQHQRGTGVDVFLDPPAAARASTPFLTSKDWEHPVTANDPIQLGANSYVRTRCQMRGDGKAAFQGQNKLTDEMCMFIAYYYPAIAGAEGTAFENCVDSAVPGGVGDEYGVGTATCAQTSACVQACSPADFPRPGDGRIDVGACYQKCIVNSCPSAGAPFSALSMCVQTKCSEACSQGGDCASCVATQCGSEYGTCQAQTCS